MNILAVLPELQTKPFAHILPSLERHEISVADLLSIEPVDVARRAQVPAREVKKLTDAVLKALHSEYGFESDSNADETQFKGPLVKSGLDLIQQWNTISLLDDSLDESLGGGVPTRYITEITGESGVGKTQFLLTLLLSVQLPPPIGLGRSAIYISTEGPLQTSRLTQIIEDHPRLSSLEASAKPSLARILSIRTPDLEYQDHILRYQVPVAVKRENVGLLVIDSVTTNFRAELARPGERNQHAGSMAKRSTQLMELGMLLRNLARTENLAVVVANQVADRFYSGQAAGANFEVKDASLLTNSTQPERTGYGESPVNSQQPRVASMPSSTVDLQQNTDWNESEVFSLEHQQRWFTGWGDQKTFGQGIGLKTPSLGLVWANEIACRIALIKDYKHQPLSTSHKGAPVPMWTRYFKLVFAPWAPSMDENAGLEFVISRSGIRSVTDGAEEPPSRDETAADGEPKTEESVQSTT